MDSEIKWKTAFSILFMALVIWLFSSLSLGNNQTGFMIVNWIKSIDSHHMPVQTYQIDK